MNLQALEKKHKELGEEIERLKQPKGVWAPKDGDSYYRVGQSGATFLHKINREHTEGIGIDHHDVYQYRVLSEKASILQRRANLIIQACLNFDPDFEPEWRTKYGFHYCHRTSAWIWLIVNSIDNSAAYVSTLAIADKVIAYLNSQEIK